MCRLLSLQGGGSVLVVKLIDEHTTTFSAIVASRLWSYRFDSIACCGPDQFGHPRFNITSDAVGGNFESQFSVGLQLFTVGMATEPQPFFFAVLIRLIPIIRNSSVCG